MKNTMSKSLSKISINTNTQQFADQFFSVETSNYHQKTLDAMAEAKRISCDPDVKGYSGMDELKTALADNEPVSDH